MEKDIQNWEERFDNRYDHYNPKNDRETHIPTWNGGDYNDIKSFIRQILASQKARYVEMGDKMTKFYAHEFEIGYSKCSFCQQSRIVFERIRTTIKKDEKTGGEIVDVTEKQYDITGQFCPKNPYTGYNHAIKAYQNKIKEDKV